MHLLSFRKLCFLVGLFPLLAGAGQSEMKECLLKVRELPRAEKKDQMLICLSQLKATKENLIPEGASFRADAEYLKRDEDVIRESGLVNGVAYSVYRVDGSGAVQGEPEQDIGDGAKLSKSNHWSIGCKRDAMNDKVTCHLKRGDFWVFVGPTGRPTVSVGENNFPGRSITVRLGNGDPITTNDKHATYDAKTSQRIVSQLSKETTFRTRYMKWPYDNWIDAEYVTYGFAVAYEYTKWATRQGNNKKTKNTKAQ